MSEIGDRIASARVMARLSAAELGELAGLSRGAVGMIETRDANRAAATTIAAIARVLGTTSDWLVSGVGDQPAKEAVLEAVEAARVVKKVADEAKAAAEEKSSPHAAPGKEGAA